jgi:hypothetical protein
MRRTIVALVSVGGLGAVLIGSAATAVLLTGRAERPPPAVSSTTAATDERLIVVGAGAGAMGEVQRVVVDEAGATVERHGLGVKCLRGYIAGAMLACLRVGEGPTAGYEAVTYDASRIVNGPVAGPITTADVLAKVPLPGIPSRVRVSPSGRIIAWTSFVRGDSYAPGDFSTRTGLYDLTTGTLVGSIEDFRATVDGAPWRREDVNYWGVTLASDDRTFYATLASAGRTWLVRGDLSARTITSVRQNVECPSLSPDETRIAYKKRVGDVWRLTVLDLMSGAETPLAEAASVDDQVAWLDARTVLYARPARGRDGSDVWRVSADGGGTPAVYLADAGSPAVIDHGPGGSAP